MAVAVDEHAEDEDVALVAEDRQNRPMLPSKISTRNLMHMSAR